MEDHLDSRTGYSSILVSRGDTGSRGGTRSRGGPHAIDRAPHVPGDGSDD